MMKSLRTLLALIVSLMVVSQAQAAGSVHLFDFDIAETINCNYIAADTIPRSYTYNDIGGTGGGARVIFPHDFERCLGDSSGSVGGVAPPYVPPEGVIFAASVVTYYHNDALGSPVAATDGEGAVLWSEEYRPYGARLIKEDEGTNEEWFTGKPHEEDLGLSYFGARWYDPESGRFMGVDTVGVDSGNPLSFSRYVYANNNPYRYVDPDGNVPLDTIWDVGNVIYDAGKIGYGFFTGNQQLINEGLTDIALDSAAALVPYVPAGVTKLRHLDDAASAAKNTVIIGEDMNRVKKYADKTGGDTIHGWLNGRALTQELNDQFIAEMKSQGREFKDLGPAFGRRMNNRIDSNKGRGPSSGYGKERRDLLGYGKIEHLYKRSGKYEGGVPGFD